MVRKDHQDTKDRKAHPVFQAMKGSEAAVVNQAALGSQVPQEQADPQENEALQDPKVTQAGRAKKVFVALLVHRGKLVNRDTKDVKVPLEKWALLDNPDYKDPWVNQEHAVPQATQDQTGPQDVQDQWVRRANQDFQVKRELQELQERLVNQDSKDPTERKDILAPTDLQDPQALTASQDHQDQKDRVVLQALTEIWDLVASVVDQDHQVHLAKSDLSVRRDRQLSATVDMDMVRRDILHMIPKAILLLTILLKTTLPRSTPLKTILQ